MLYYSRVPDRMPEAKVSDKLMYDFLGTIGSIHRMNARHAQGYAFYTDSKGEEIIRGGYIFANEIVNDDLYDYYYDFKTKKLYDLAPWRDEAEWPQMSKPEYMLIYKMLKSDGEDEGKIHHAFFTYPTMKDAVAAYYDLSKKCRKEASIQLRYKYDQIKIETELAYACGYRKIGQNLESAKEMYNEEKNK